MIGAALVPGMRLLKDDRAPDPILVDAPEEDRTDSFGGIRCPLCRWQPSAASRWSCEWIDTPEPFFQACGTVWNTFSTRGRCPGCSHQWRWTSCHRCGQWSPHDEWYDEED